MVGGSGRPAAFGTRTSWTCVSGDWNFDQEHLHPPVFLLQWGSVSSYVGEVFGPIAEVNPAANNCCAEDRPARTTAL